MVPLYDNTGPMSEVEWRAMTAYHRLCAERASRAPWRSGPHWSELPLAERQRIVDELATWDDIASKVARS